MGKLSKGDNLFMSRSKSNSDFGELILWGFVGYGLYKLFGKNEPIVGQAVENKTVGYSKSDVIRAFFPSALSEDPRELTLQQIESEYRHLVFLARQKGAQMPAYLLEHFLNGTGQPVEFSHEWLRSNKKVKEAESRVIPNIEASISDLLFGDRINVKQLIATVNGKDQKMSGVEILSLLKTGIIVQIWDKTDQTIRYSSVLGNIAENKKDELYYASGDSNLETKYGLNLQLDSKAKVIFFTGVILYRHTDKYDWENGGNANIPAYGIVSDAFARRLTDEGNAENFKILTKWNKKMKGQIYLDSYYRKKSMYINEGSVELMHDVNYKVFPPKKI